MATYGNYDPVDRFDPHNLQAPYNGPEGSHPQQTFEAYSDLPQPPQPRPYSTWSQYPPSQHTTGNNSFAGASSTMEERMPLKAYSEGSGMGAMARPRKGGLSRKVIALIVLALIIIIAAAVVLPVYFLVIKPKSSSASDGSDSGDSGSVPDSNDPPGNDGNNTTPDPPQRIISGGDGSEITTEDGRKFTYRNQFGGFWVHDPTDPFNVNAQPNQWTPALNQTWQWGVHRVYGVNLGGLFLLEPFINAGVFQKYPGAVDEFTLAQAMRAAGTLEQEMEEHYNTFITEEDIAEIAGAGLNWLRVPIGFWAVESYDNEPFLERTSWKFFLRVVEWARKYGLRIYLDLHAVPGGQNGLNHSARIRFLSFLRGPMGLANAQRTLYYLRVLTQFISQPEYRSVIPMIGLVNEPQTQTNAAITQDALRSFYLEAYNVIREVGGFGEGNGPYIAVGDGFRSALDWRGIMPGADRFVMDIHPYVAFDDGAARTSLPTELADDGQLGGIWPRLACDRWGGYFNTTRQTLGVTVGGEFSAAVNDCGLYMREVGVDSIHPQCSLYNAWETWSDEWKEGLMNFVLASFDSIGDFFFWTWKIGDSAAGRVETPMWSYKLGLEQGWIPRDPRVAIGKCAALGSEQIPFDGNFQPWQIGALAQPTIPAEYSAQFPWPPTSLPAVEDVPISLLPTYVEAGTPITMPVATFSGAAATVTEGVDGWFNDADTAPAVTPSPGCVYPDQYTVSAFDVVPTLAFC